MYINVIAENAEHLWKSVLTVSNAGRKRGRAANLKNKRKDFNKGQVYGIGKKNISWPGIHAPPTISAQKIEDYILPSDPERQNKIIKAREYYESLRKKKKKLTPLERGWSGTKLHGRKIGPPEPVDDGKSSLKYFTLTCSHIYNSLFICIGSNARLCKCF